ncbi:MAG: histidine kinase [Betaproteobacteria bacterium]|jgi:sigma-54 dependent transcriptional regulator, acetoin dehydrogenase operon transcriptional activator AcoR|nr:histidine kinase [Betaproteobacteria bacterium]NBP45325.1 histidine kinase [Betaproteobacteria bacterium]
MNPLATPSQRLQLIDQARHQVMLEGAQRSADVAEWVTRSWQRCLQRGRRPDERVEFDLIETQRQNALKEQHQALRSAAQAEIQRLCRAISGTHYFALLTDASGVVVDVGGNPNHRDRRVHAIARIGVDLSELSVGTSAIGAALGEQRSVWLHRGEHFFNDTSVYSCAGAPIASPDGRSLGMLDLTGVMTVERPELQHLVSLSARSIEETLLGLQPHRLALRLNWPGHLQNSSADACILLDDEGHICARNSLATQLLRLPVGRVPLSDVFAAPESQIYDLALRPEPTELPLWSGLTVQCVARAASPGNLGTAPLAMALHSAPLARDAGVLKRVEDSMIAQAMKAAKGHVSEAAKALGISRATLYRRLKHPPPPRR